MHRVEERDISTGMRVSSISLGPPAFYFRQRHGKLDWKKLACVNVDEVVREVDLGVLQQLLDEVAFSDITVEDIPPTGVDDLSVKLIRISQLTIEYLLHVQERQEAYIHGLIGQLEAANKHNQSLKADAPLAAKEEGRMKRESAQHQSVITTCQSLLRQYGIDPARLLASISSLNPPHPLRSGERGGAQPKDPHFFPQGQLSGDGIKLAVSPVLTSPTEARLCDICGKAFSSEGFLNKHIKRRHPGMVPADPLLSPPPKSEGVATQTVATAEVEVVDKNREDSMLKNEKFTEDEGKQESEKIYEGVEEGARRLGELVREREQAKLRSEMETLRSEIEQLKKQAAGAAVKEERSNRDDGEGRRRRVRGVIATRRIVRQCDVRRKADALRKWRIAAATSSRPESVVVHRTQPLAVDPPPPTPLADAAIATLAVITAAPTPRRMTLQEMMTTAHSSCSLRPPLELANAVTTASALTTTSTMEHAESPAVLVIVVEKAAAAAWQISEREKGLRAGEKVADSCVASRSRLERAAERKRADLAAREGGDGIRDGESLSPVPFERKHPLRLASGVEIMSHFRVDAEKTETARLQVAKELKDRANRLDVNIERTGMRDEEFRSRVEAILAQRRGLVAANPCLTEAYASVTKELRRVKGDPNTGWSGSRHTVDVSLSRVLTAEGRTDVPERKASSAAKTMPRSKGSGTRRSALAEGTDSFGRSAPVDAEFRGSTGGSGEIGIDSKELLAMAKRTAEINWEAVQRRRSIRCNHFKEGKELDCCRRFRPRRRRNRRQTMSLSPVVSCSLCEAAKAAQGSTFSVFGGGVPARDDRNTPAHGGAHASLMKATTYAYRTEEPSALPVGLGVFATTSATAIGGRPMSHRDPGDGESVLLHDHTQTGTTARTSPSPREKNVAARGISEDREEGVIARSPSVAQVQNGRRAGSGQGTEVAGVGRRRAEKQVHNGNRTASLGAYSGGEGVKTPMFPAKSRHVCTTAIGGVTSGRDAADGREVAVGYGVEAGDRLTIHETIHSTPGDNAVTVADGFETVAEGSTDITRVAAGRNDVKVACTGNGTDEIERHVLHVGGRGKREPDVPGEGEDEMTGVTQLSTYQNVSIGGAATVLSQSTLNNVAEEVECVIRQEKPRHVKDMSTDTVGAEATAMKSLMTSTRMPSSSDMTASSGATQPRSRTSTGQRGWTFATALDSTGADDDELSRMTAGGGLQAGWGEAGGNGAGGTGVLGDDFSSDEDDGIELTHDVSASRPVSGTITETVSEAGVKPPSQRTGAVTTRKSYGVTYTGNPSRPTTMPRSNNTRSSGFSSSVSSSSESSADGNPAGIASITVAAAYSKKNTPFDARYQSMRSTENIQIGDQPADEGPREDGTTKMAAGVDHIEDRPTVSPGESAEVVENAVEEFGQQTKADSSEDDNQLLQPGPITTKVASTAVTQVLGFSNDTEAVDVSLSAKAGAATAAEKSGDGNPIGDARANWVEARRKVEKPKLIAQEASETSAVQGFDEDSQDGCDEVVAAPDSTKEKQQLPPARLEEERNDTIMVIAPAKGPSVVTADVKNKLSVDKRVDVGRRDDDSDGGAAGRRGGFKMPQYGFFTLGSGLSQFPKREMPRSLDPTATTVTSITAVSTAPSKTCADSGVHDGLMEKRELLEARDGRSDNEKERIVDNCNEPSATFRGADDRGDVDVDVDDGVDEIMLLEEI